jgi:spore germination cell wall hydrolase CwlJ-like protein
MPMPGTCTAIALAAGGAVDREVGLATHYHADYVVPRWRDSMVKMAQVGTHLFYRWPGY